MPRVKPFRFGVQLASLPPNDWIERVRQIERWGYDSILWPDHFFFPEWDPIVALSAVAAATTRIKTGTLVYGVDYRHPVVLARSAATAHLLSGGRVEFGIGAGWTETDYAEAGMRYDAAGLRVERLEEALHVIKGIWSNERTSFAGKSYQVAGAQRAVELSSLPKILIGGGGKRVLGVAGRHADIVGINPKVAEGKITAAAARDGMLERTREKIRWVQEAASAASRDFEALELNALVFGTVITDDAKPVREFLGKQSGMSPEEVADCPLYLTGSPREIQDTLLRRREELGFNYIVIQGRDFGLLEKFAAEVVAPLARNRAMTKLGIDFENVDRTWWEAGGAELWEGITGDRDAGSIVVDDDLAASWLNSAAAVPGWATGPEYAPHPVRASSLREDDPDA